MRSRPIQACSILLITLLFGFHANALQTTGARSTSDNWEICTICGIPARVALNASPGPTIVRKRHIYLLIEASDFTEGNLRKVFDKLSATYPDPTFLTIIAFSNKEFLKQLITAEETDSVIDFADTPEGRSAERHYAERYPPTTGYFRAYYLRTAKDQSFQYTPNPAEERTIEVILKSKTGTGRS